MEGKNSTTQRPQATMQDVAREAGVSLSTVSYVLSGVRPVSQATQDRVGAAIERLDFRRNAAAVNLASRRTRVIALVYPVLDLGISRTAAEFVRGATVRASEMGYDLVVWPHTEPDQIVELVRAGKADAILLMEVELADPRVAVLRAQKIPFAMIGRTIDDAGVAWVDVDFAATVVSAMDRLTRLGHTHLGLINHASSTHGHRYGAGVRASGAFADAVAHLPLSGHEVFCDESPQAGRQALAELLEADPLLTAVLTMNEDATFGVLAEAQARGLDIPRDLSVLSLVTSPRVAALYSPPLSSFDVRGEETGGVAIDSLLRVIAKDAMPEGVLTHCDFHDRGSVAVPPQRD